MKGTSNPGMHCFNNSTSFSPRKSKEGEIVLSGSQINPGAKQGRGGV